MLTAVPFAYFDSREFGSMTSSPLRFPEVVQGCGKLTRKGRMSIDQGQSNLDHRLPSRKRFGGFAQVE